MLSFSDAVTKNPDQSNLIVSFFEEPRVKIIICDICKGYNFFLELIEYFSNES